MRVANNGDRRPVYSFLGPDGAGKTTMVWMLVTLLFPIAGRAVDIAYTGITPGSRRRGRRGSRALCYSLCERD